MTQMVQIPAPTSPQFGMNIKQWIETRDGISGPSGLKLDRFVRVADLLDSDFINSLAGYQFPITRVNTDYGYTGDTSAPRPPTNLVVTSEVFRNILTWDDPNSDNFWYIEVYRAKVPAGDAAPTVGDAIKIASVPKTVESFVDTEVSITSYDHYYWIRAVSYAGIASLWQDGYIEGHTTINATIDSIMTTLKGADPDAWSSIVDYVADDRVLQGGKRYKCILANLNQVPPNATYWEQSGILITGNIGGVNTVGIDGNLVVDDTILARCINVNDAFIGMTIQSTVYTPGVTGWQINKDGSADFTSGTASWSMITGVGKPDDNADVTSASAQAVAWLTDAGALATQNDLDGVPNGANYGRVLTTAISAGKIVLTSAGVSGTLPTSLSAAKCTDANADQTSANVAASISGQGALATQNDLDGVPNGANYGRVQLSILDSGYLYLLRKSADSTERLLVTAGGIEAYANNVKVIDIANTPSITVGEVGASKSNVHITSGAIQLRNNTTAKLTLANDGSIDMDGNMTLGSAGWIKVWDTQATPVLRVHLGYIP